MNTLTTRRLNDTLCPRCSRPFTLDPSEVNVEGRIFHRSCGALDIWEAFQRRYHAVWTRMRRQTEQRLGAFSVVRHPPLPSELHPSHVCEEAGLIHADGSLLRISTDVVLERWHEQGRQPVQSFKRCKGWHIDRTMRYLRGMLEATTVAFDNLVHSEAEQRYPSDIIGMMWRYGTSLGMQVELGQYAAHCCNLCLKTLYALRHPEAESKIFKEDIGHDISEAWGMIADEQGYLVSIMRDMPLFPPTEVDKSTLEADLAKCAHFEELRWYELDGDRKHVSRTLHLQLAWAAFLRCQELTAVGGREVSQKGQQSRRKPGRTKISRAVPPSLQQRPSWTPLNTDKAHRSEILRQFDKDPTPPDWLRLCKSIHGMRRYSPEGLTKSSYGLIHARDDIYVGAYVFGSTFQVMRLWLSECGLDYPKLDPGDFNTGLGNVALLTHTLRGRLEVITANYAYTSGLLTLHTIEGRPMIRDKGGQFMLYTQAAVFACELTMKWLYALTHPHEPLSGYKTHNVQTLWGLLEDHHDNILEVFQAMPLFQADVPIDDRVQLSAGRVAELLGRFRTTYVDARYGITDASRESVRIDFDYRINLHLAWSVFLYGLLIIADEAP